MSPPEPTPPPVAAPPSPTRSGGRIAWLALRILVTCAAFYYLSTKIELTEVPAAIARVSPFAMCMLVAANYVAVQVAVERWRLLLRAMGAERVPGRLALFRLYLVATFYNTFLPGGVGGELVRGVASRSAFGPGARTEGLFVVLVERIMGLSGLLVLVAATTMLAPMPGVPAAPLLATAGLLGATAPLLGLMLGRRLADYLPEPLAGWARAIPIPRSVAPFVAALALSVVVQALVAVGGHGLVHSVAQDVPLRASLAVIPLAAATVFLPITVGGAGVFEGAFIAMYALLGVAEHDALAACLGYRLCYFAVAGSGGLWMLTGAPLQVDAAADPQAPAPPST